MGIRNLQPLTAFVALMVIIDAALSPVILIWSEVHLESLQRMVGPIANEVDYGTIGFHILTVIVFSVWIYRAGANLIAAGFDDLEFTPGSRIWWFAAPIANLFKPFQGMRELWNASHGSTDYEGNNGIVGLWWALWLISSIANNIVFRLPGDPGPEINWALAVLDGILAVVAILLIRGIADAQSANLSSEGLDQVFG